MSKFVCPETRERIEALMFEDFNDSTCPRERFLQNELVRYVPELAGRSEEEIANFVEYMRCVYLNGLVPIVGRPIASLNPTFVDSLDGIKLKEDGLSIYTRAAVKENGFRFQLHRGAQNISAFTRQFTRYDLRMFPELQATLSALPVMIGDAELVNKRHKHLAGFHRVEMRIPDTSFWPKRGSDGLSENILGSYLANPKLFLDGKPLEDLELTLAFHGMFAIASPKKWERPISEQAESLISLCNLPINYRHVDEILDQLSEFILNRGLNARVVERQVFREKKSLDRYVKKQEREGLEGVCVVQSAENSNGEPIVIGRSIKIKKYETLDMALLGVYFSGPSRGLSEENLAAALVGLYDKSLGAFLPAMKVNLNPNGVQVKTAGQRERLTLLRGEIAKILSARNSEKKEKVLTLYDVFMMQGEKTLEYILERDFERKFFVGDVFAEVPRGHNLIDLYKVFRENRKSFESGGVGKLGAAGSFILKHFSFLSMIDTAISDKSRERIFRYFSRAQIIKTLSNKMIKPHLIVSTDDPIVLETFVFDLKWGKSPYPAGFHTAFGDSFFFNNSYAERIRYDKKATTDYETVYKICRTNTVQKK